MRKLIERGASIDWGEVHSALKGGHAGAFELLLQNGGERVLREEFDESPFRRVSFEPHAEPIWERLIELGFDPREPGDDYSLSPLGDAFLRRDEASTAFARFLLERGVRPDAETFLHIAYFGAAYGRDLDDLRLLLDYDIDADMRLESGVTVLMALVSIDEADAEVHERIRLLLEHGADPTAVDDEGRSVLDHAVGESRKIIEDAIRRRNASGERQ